MLFFFSIRRRHTRFDCDWSSDVCSSDLVDNKTWKQTASLKLPGGEGVADLTTDTEQRQPGTPRKNQRAASMVCTREIGRASCRERVKVAVVGAARNRQRQANSANECII